MVDQKVILQSMVFPILWMLNTIFFQLVCTLVYKKMMESVNNLTDGGQEQRILSVFTLGPRRKKNCLQGF